MCEAPPAERRRGFLLHSALMQAREEPADGGAGWRPALTYWLGARLHSSRAGSWAAACALASPLLLDFYNPGMSQELAAVLGLTVWIILLDSRGALAAGVAALVAAAAWYLRGESLLFLPIWLWIAARPDPAARSAPTSGVPRRTRPILFAAAYPALCLPWMAIMHQA